MSFSDWSHKFQSTHFQNTEQFPESLIEAWFNQNSADNWRHNRMYEGAQLLLDNQNSTWITVGDGRWGLDSIRLMNLGFNNVLATDISENLLEAAKLGGKITDYLVANAEELPFENKSIDYIFCKESLHHFPQPFKALYEFNRVARKGFLLIEPNDPIEVNLQFIKGISILSKIKSTIYNIYTLLRGKKIDNGSLKITTSYNPAAWEASGNYTYGFNKRDFERFAYGIGLKGIAIKGLNDHYVEGAEFEPSDILNSLKFREILRVIEKKNENCREGLGQYDLNMAWFFLEEITEHQKNILIENDWEFILLKPNPYFHSVGGL